MEYNNKRTEIREQVIGDVFWAYAADKHENEAALVEQSKSGLSILTRKPVKEGSLLRVYCKGSWMEDRYVTVRWCIEIAPETWRCGLAVVKHY